MNFNYTRRVHYHETDQMGVVHHSNYIRYFEESRTEFLNTAGLPYSEMERAGVMSPVIEAQCRYIKPARYDDVITITACVESVDQLRYTVRYTVLSAQGDTLAQGYTRHCYINASFRPVSLKKLLPETYEAFTKLVAADIIG